MRQQETRVEDPHKDKLQEARVLFPLLFLFFSHIADVALNCEGIRPRQKQSLDGRRAASLQRHGQRTNDAMRGMRGMPRLEAFSQVTTLNNPGLGIKLFSLWWGESRALQNMGLASHRLFQMINNTLARVELH